MTNASSISLGRNRATSRLDRSMASMRSAKEDEPEVGGGRRLPPGGRLPTLKREDALKLYEADDAHDAEMPQGELANDADDDGVQREDSGGSGSTIPQQATKSQMEQENSVAGVAAVTEQRSKGHTSQVVRYRSRRVQQQQSKEASVHQQPAKSDQQQQQNQQQQLPWGRNIEEGISGILKRLDQLGISNNGTMFSFTRCAGRLIHLSYQSAHPALICVSHS